MTAVEATARVVPVSPLKLPPAGLDGTTVGDRRALRRLIHLEGAPIVLELRHEDDGSVELHARAADERLAAAGLERVRFWTGVDDDMSPFLRRFADDPLIGPSVRDAAWLRPHRRAMPFEALLAAVCEQLVTDERATAIKQRVIAAHGLRQDGLLDAPDAAAIAALAPAQLAACDLAPKRAVSLIAAAREVASGRVDLLDPDAHLRGWRRLRTLPGIGPWTLSCLALHGQGHADALPAGDHAYRTAVARLTDRRGLADEQEVVAFFEPYRPWRGVAGWHVLRTARKRGMLG